MPYKINWEKDGVLVKFNGVFSYNENMDANIELYSDSKFENLKYIVWDLSEVSEFDITKEEAEIASMHDKLASSRLPKMKMAILVVDKQLRRLADNYVATSRNNIKGWTFLVSDNIESIRTWVTS